MTRLSSFFAAGVFLLSVAVLPARAYADPITLDQANAGPRIGGYGVSTNTTLAQTFTVGITGLMTQIDLGIFNPNDTTTFPDPLTIEIRGTTGGAANSSVLQSWTVPIGSVPQDRFGAMSSFMLSGLDVFAGETLAIVLSTGTHGNYGWSTACCYSGGSAFVPGNVPNGDFMFRTYVDPQPLSGAATPEPATWILLGFGLLAISMVSRRSSRLYRGYSTQSMG